MRRVVLGMQVSLDGFVARPGGELDWIWRTFDEEVKKSILDVLRGIDTYLLGRVNYLEQVAHWPEADDEVAPLLNAATKIVFSRTLDRLDWANARLATDDPATEIARLKQQPGKDIAVGGGASLARSLSELGLIDEYSFVIHPILLGGGLPLFQGLPEPVGMELVAIRHFATGAVHVRYRRN
ncbi:dihydrofolate reductase family protein [Nonomuraea jiangxiensis]|uniref:Dihydrofolate reductase n=1 Tax=Nonomuraea jiangxiensis TaxID=633440 RepID=A0A1G9JJ15_9ACTN|nr:dihydrofolate reductase family protein [Nonomuraea jiangxiensis]SDL37529.1 Dihydrofolate reductase [Nonomuraea jiangxiensis]